MGLVVALAPAAASEWSGTIEMVETIESSLAQSTDRAELDDYLQTLQDRLARTRTQLLVAGSGPAARILAQDEVFYQNELDQCLFARGGAVVVGRTRMWVSGQRIRIEGDAGTVLADGASGRAWIASGDRVVEVATEPAPPLAEGILGADGILRVTLPVNGLTMNGAVRSDLPNPFAMAVLSQGQVVGGGIGRVLATFPGMPTVVEIPGRTTRRLTFTAVAGAVDPTLLATP